MNFKNAQNIWILISTWRRQWHPTPVVLPGKSHGWRSLVGCCLWGRTESDWTERLHFHFSLSFIGEGNGNPLQCSCLETPRDGEPGGLPSLGSHRVGHDWSDSAAAAAAECHHEKRAYVHVQRWALWLWKTRLILLKTLYFQYKFSCQMMIIRIYYIR